MTENRTVKACRNCTISEVWVQITGMPDKVNHTDPYPLFNHLKQCLEKKYELQCMLRKVQPNLLNIQTGQHNIDICPPFWNGEIRWTDNNKKILRTGHQFIALHSFFDYETPYSSYDKSFQSTFEEVLGYINTTQAFKAIEIRMRYINTIILKAKPDGKLNIKDYFKAGLFFNPGYHLPLRNSSVHYEFISSNNIIIGMNINISTHSTQNNELISTIETTGVDLLKEKTELSNNSNFLSKVQSIKQELKTIFFDTMTDNTKNNIMEAQYA